MFKTFRTAIHYFEPELTNTVKWQDLYH